jgi:hypothetical protein
LSWHDGEQSEVAWRQVVNSRVIGLVAISVTEEEQNEKYCYHEKEQSRAKSRAKRYGDKKLR